MSIPKHKLMTPDGEIVEYTKFDLKFMILSNKMIDVYNLSWPDEISDQPSIVKKYFFDLGFFISHIEFFINLLNKEYQSLTDATDSLDPVSKKTFYKLLESFNNLYYHGEHKDTPIELYDKMEQWLEEYLFEHEIIVTSNNKEEKVNRITSNLILSVEQVILNLHKEGIIQYEDIIEFSGHNPTREEQYKVLALIERFFEEEDYTEAVELEREIKLRLQGIYK